MTAEAEIQAMVDRETAAWDRQDADTLVDLFHPDMVWPWPPHAASHDPETWVFPQGRYDRERWRAGWLDLFRSHELVHNRRRTVRLCVSEQGDGGFAVVDVDTLWRRRSDGQPFHWKGRACKGYTRVQGKWLLIFHTGLLEYDETAVRYLLERDRVASVVNTLFVATDARDWTRVRGCFAPVVRFDMTSLAGGEPQEMSPEQIAAGWESGLRPIESVHHQTGNLSVTCRGGEAEASCYGIAYHFRRTRSGRNTRLFVGSYDFHLRLHGAGWKIDLFRFNLRFVDGNPELESEPGA